MCWLSGRKHCPVADYVLWLRTLILSAIIIGRSVIVRKISADKNRTVLIADIVELILSILVLAVTVLYGYGMNGFVYMVFYSVSCIGTLVSDLI